MSRNYIPPAKAFDLSAGCTHSAWRRFRKIWNNYELVTGLIKKTKDIDMTYVFDHTEEAEDIDWCPTV